MVQYSTMKEGLGGDLGEIEWARVRAYCGTFGVAAEPIIEQAKSEGVSPEVVELAFDRTLAYLRRHGSREGAGLEELDSVPPGMFDMRIVLQGEIWIDILRRRMSIGSLTQSQIVQILEGLTRLAPQMHFELGDGDDAEAWLASTPLVVALRQQLRRLRGRIT